MCGMLLENGAKVADIPRYLLTEPLSFENFLKEAKPDYIIHLAAYGNHSDQNDLDETIITNILKTYTLLRASMNIDYKAFINVSSSSVYGENNYSMKEDDPLNPKTMYGCTKVASEYLARSFVINNDKPIINIRPFSVYGVGEVPNRLMHTVCRSLILGEEIKLHPDPLHDWIYIEDFINGVFSVMENADKFKGESINIDTGRERSNKDVVDILKEVSGKTTKVTEEKGGNRNDIKHWRADISKLRMCDWKPETSLETGLLKTYEYFAGLYKKQEKTETDLRSAMNKSLEAIGVKFE